MNDDLLTKVALLRHLARSLEDYWPALQYLGDLFSSGPRSARIRGSLNAAALRVQDATTELSDALDAAVEIGDERIKVLVDSGDPSQPALRAVAPTMPAYEDVVARVEDLLQKVVDERRPLAWPPKWLMERFRPRLLAVVRGYADPGVNDERDTPVAEVVDS